VPRVWAVVVAGGSGTRFGKPKQFVELRGRPVVAWAVEACRAVAGSVVLVLPDTGTRSFGADVVVAGGPSRSASVRCGLAAVPEECDVVVVHDAARPFAAATLFRSVVDALADPGVAGAVCAVPVADTVKRLARPLAPGGGVADVVETLDRGALVAVQTPQAFRTAALRRAHASAADATDDAALIEALGLRVRAVPGDPRNLKLTVPGDLALAEHLLGS